MYNLRRPRRSDERATPPFTGRLTEDVALLRRELSEPDDLTVRELSLAGTIECTLLFLDNLSDSQVINQSILRPLMQLEQLPCVQRGDGLLRWVCRRLVPVGETKLLHGIRNAQDELLRGFSILLVDGYTQALAFNSRRRRGRTPGEPKTEVVIRGPREGFTESLSEGIAMVRERVKDGRLKVATLQLGSVTASRVAVIYLRGVAADSLVETVMERLRRIRTDAVIESGYVEQFLEDHPKSPFPQIMHTERPDRVIGNILEGRVAILVDGTPFALVIPSTAVMFLQSPEDYYERPFIVVLSRLVRVVVVALTVSLPALYVALTAFHPEMLPSEVLLTITATQIRLPFPTAVEALTMEMFVEMLLEASVRLPTPVGPTVGIVGALIIGEAAVRAGFAGPVMVIIIALTAIASYAIPSYVLAFSLKLVRIFLLVLTSFFGLIGLMTGVNLLITHLASLESFGVPYLSPMAPFNAKEMRDFILRGYLWRMKWRPDQARSPQRRRLPEPARPDTAPEGEHG